jgi:hypothetical protein
LGEVPLAEALPPAALKKRFTTKNTKNTKANTKNERCARRRAGFSSVRLRVLRVLRGEFFSSAPQTRRPFQAGRRRLLAAHEKPGGSRGAPGAVGRYAGMNKTFDQTVLAEIGHSNFKLGHSMP